MGQADFGKLGLNNRNHSENCHHLSLYSKQKICNKIKKRARSASVRDLSLPWTDVDFIIITIRHNSPFFSVAAQSIRNSCGYTRLMPEVTLWVIALGRDRFGFPVRFIPPVTLQIITRGQLLTWQCF